MTKLGDLKNQEVQYSQKNAHAPGNILSPKDPTNNKDRDDEPYSKKTRVEDKSGDIIDERDASLPSQTNTSTTAKTKEAENPEELLAIKKQIAREKNRVHSRNSRLRKKDLISKMKEVSLATYYQL